MTLSIQFLGAAGTVTGSRHLVEFDGRRILVDCGLFQGLKELRLQNRAPFPVDPASIEAVILTHAHLDHSGYLPLLVKGGFRGKIYCTAPTKELTRILLFDAAGIEEEDADYANQKGFSKHSPALPLFTTMDAHAVLKELKDLPLETWHEQIAGLKFRFKSSGHILGSAFVELEIKGKRIVFSGDLGRGEPVLLAPRVSVEKADFLILESTYGDRLHPSDSVLDSLAKVVSDTVAKKGHLLIPSFAVGRTQDLLQLFAILRRDCRIPNIPIYLDSPLAEEATEVYVRYPEWRKKPVSGAPVFSKVATIVKSRQQSKDLLEAKMSTIVIAGSGMISGGRILHHLAHRIGDLKNTVLLVGFQAAGTRGRLLREGAPELKMHGEYFQVRAEVRELTGLSAHADQKETLEWLKGFSQAPSTTFIVHGEPQPADALRLKVHDSFGWKVVVPKQLERFVLAE
ncbi:MAG: MBL fold metallo-hydrolase RNA specificity domain-containing protein [Bdellovibrionota bacterium]